MKKTFKKLRAAIALMLVVFMLGACIPATASAATTENPPVVEEATELNGFLQNLFATIRDFIQNIIDFINRLFGCGKEPEPPVLVEEISAEISAQKLVIGDNAKITVTVIPDNAADKSVVFASSDEAVATVDAEGNVTAVAAGNATVTVTAADSGEVSVAVAVSVYDGAISDYEEFKTYKTYNGSYVLDEDMDADDAVFFGSATHVLLDMNGKTINALKKTQYIFCAQTNNENVAGSLHLTGDGVVNAGLGFYANKTGSVITVDNGTYITDSTKTLDKKNVHSLVQKESKMIINDGSFISPVDNTVLFYVIYSGTLEINGGFFENTADKTPELMIAARNPEYNNKIFIKGGTFVNWNPCDAPNFFDGNEGEAPFGPYIILCEGYTVVAEEQANGDIWYSVVPVAA